jgi:type II secretory pathway component GspD/PulD (secretin)
MLRFVAGLNGFGLPVRSLVLATALCGGIPLVNAQEPVTETPPAADPAPRREGDPAPGERRPDDQRGSPGRDRGQRGGGFPGGGFPGGGFPGGGFPGGGFPGGRGGGGRGGVVGLAGREEIQAEVKLTPEQIEKVRVLAESAPNGLDPTIGEKLRNAQTDDERTALFAEMAKARDAIRKQQEAELQKIVTPEQFTRLRQIAWQRAGSAALSEEEAQSALKLSDDQKAGIAKLVEERRAAEMALGFRGSREERDKLRQESDAKVLALLTAEQRTSWTTLQGPVFEVAQAAAPGADSPLGGPPAPPPAVTNVPPASVPTATAVDPATPAKPVNAGKLVFNFRFAPWENVLKWFADQADLRLDLSATPPGVFNYYDDQEYSVSETLDVLNGYLLQKGYILVRRDKFLVCLNIDNGIPPNLIPQVSVEELPSRGRNELLSIVLTLEGTDADTAKADIDQLVGPQGKVVPLKKTNRLFITDIGANLRKIHELLSAGGAIATGARGFKSFVLKHISPTDADRILRELFGLAKKSTAPVRPGMEAVPQWGDRRDWDRRREGGDENRGGPQPPVPPVAPTTNKDTIQIAVDLRTGSLLVTAKSEDLLLVEQAIKTIDVEGTGTSGRDGRPQLEVFPLQTADTRAVVETLNTLLPGLQITEDTKARRVSVYAGPTDLQQVRDVIKQLDGTAGDNITVINLRRLEPVAAATSLKSLFGSGRSNDGPSIEADVQGRRIMVRGTTDQVAQVRTLLTQMGEDGNGTGGSYSSGGLRTVPLGGRDARQILSMLEQAWPTTDDRPIRIVVPSAIGSTIDDSRRNRSVEPDDAPVRKTVTPDPVSDVPVSNSRPSRGSRAEEVLQPVDLREGLAPSRKRAATPPPVTEEPVTAEPASENGVDDEESLESDSEAASDAEPETPATKPPARDLELEEALREVFGAPAEKSTPGSQPATSETKPADAAGKTAPIVVSTSGTNLLLSSDDGDALDRMEEMLNTLIQSSSSKTKWTVFYLRTADATETSQVLGSLFPSGTVVKSAESSSSSMFGGFGSSLSSLGGSVAEMTGLNSLSKSDERLRIIPETRSNALFVSGPPDAVRQVEEMLKILDANELPDSLRDRVPRMIPVEYADITKVAEVVKDVYREQIEVNPLVGGGGSSRGGSGGFNPLAMLMGGQMGGAGGRAPRVQMTIGVDERTSTLIVSASDTLFKQVQALVTSLDTAAFEAKKTIRVVPLERTSSALVTQALGALVGNVKVSSTSTPSSSSSSRSGDSSRTGSGSPPGFGGSTGFPTPGSDPGGDVFRQMIEQRMRERMMGGDRGRDR